MRHCFYSVFVLVKIIVCVCCEEEDEVSVEDKRPVDICWKILSFVSWFSSEFEHFQLWRPLLFRNSAGKVYLINKSSSFCIIHSIVRCKISKCCSSTCSCTANQSSPDRLLPGCSLHWFLGDPEALPGQMGFITPPRYWGCTCLDYMKAGCSSVAEPLDCKLHVILACWIYSLVIQVNSESLERFNSRWWLFIHPD